MEAGQAKQADAAKALTNVRAEVAGFFPTKTLTLADPSGGVTVFQHAEQGGYSATLSPGSYPLADLQRRGIGKDDLASAKVPTGYTLELYSGENFTGAKHGGSMEFTSTPGEGSCFTARLPLA